MHKVLILITFSIAMMTFSYALSLNKVFNGSLLESTSLSNGMSCPKAPVLYRGMTGTFFTIERAMENMLGDSLAELPSWRLSSIYNSLDKMEGVPDEIRWENAKRIAAKELEHLQDKQGGHVCDITNIFADLTMQGKELKIRSQSLGIAFTPNMSYAAGYIGAKIYNSSSEDNEDLKKGIMIGIKEHVARAGYASEYGNQKFAEFYVPIFVPKEDIFAAWTDNLHIEKKLDRLGNLKVEIYSVKNATLSLKTGTSLDEELIGEVVQCFSADNHCNSEEPQTNDRLDSIRGSLAKLKKRGLRFKLITIKPQ